MSRIKNGYTYEEQSQLKALGKRLQLFRKGIGIKSIELCKIAQIDRDGYIKIEKGIRNRMMTIVFQISESLGISMGNLFDHHYSKLLKEIENEEIFKSTITEDFCRLLKRKKVISLIKRYRKKKI